MIKMEIEFNTRGKWADNHMPIQYYHAGAPTNVSLEDALHYLDEAIEEITFHCGLAFDVEVLQGPPPADVVDGFLSVRWGTITDLGFFTMARTQTRFYKNDAGIVGALMTLNKNTHTLYEYKFTGNIVHELGHAAGFKHTVDEQVGHWWSRSVMTSQSSTSLIENRALSLFDALMWQEQYPSTTERRIPSRVKVSDEQDQENRRAYVPIILHKGDYLCGQLGFVPERGWTLSASSPLNLPPGIPERVGAGSISETVLGGERPDLLLRNVHYGSAKYGAVRMRYTGDGYWLPDFLNS